MHRAPGCPQFENILDGRPHSNPEPFIVSIAQVLLVVITANHVGKKSVGFLLYGGKFLVHELITFNFCFLHGVLDPLLNEFEYIE